MPTLRDFQSPGGGLRGFQSGGGLRTFNQPQQVDPDRGFFGSLIHELGLDIKGAGRVAAAIPFSVFETLGAQVPLTFDDLTSRDYLGAAAVASMFVGGAVAQGIKGTKAGVGALRAQRSILGGTKAARAATAEFTKQMTFAQRLAITAGSEATAGAFFGAVRPLESADNRMEAILTDTALFAGLGAGFNVIGQGFKATAGAKIAQLHRQRASAIAKESLQIAETSNLLAEHAGLKLWNPETLKEANVRRTPSGEVKITGAGISRSFNTFGAAIANVTNAGWTERLGTAKTAKDLIPEITKLQEAGAILDPGIVERLTRGDKLFEVIDELNLANYKSSAQMMELRGDSDKLFTSLEAETLHRNGTATDPIRLEPGVVDNIRKTLPKESWAEMREFLDPSSGKIIDGKDAEFLREAIRKGAVSVENLSEGITMKDWATELTINDGNLNNAVLVANSGSDAGFEARILSLRTLQKFHPEIETITAPLHKAAADVDIGASSNSARWGQNGFMSRQFSTQTMRNAGDIIQRNLGPTWGVAKTRALAAAKGNKAVEGAVKEITDSISRYNLRNLAKGRKGFSNLSPSIVNSTRSKVQAAIVKEQQNLATFDIDSVVARLQESSPQRALLTAPERQAFEELLESTNFTGFSERQNYLNKWRLTGANTDEVFDTYEGAWDAAKNSTDEGLLQLVPEQNVDSAAAQVLHGKELQRFKEKELASFSVDITPEIREILRGDVIAQDFGQFAPKNLVKFNDISDDPFKTLEFWGLSQEHTLGFADIAKSDFDKLITSTVPNNKSEVIASLRNKRDLMLGQPTPMERMYENSWKQVFPEVTPVNMRKVSANIRRWQGYSKLGGAWSGVINLTQTPTNTLSKLGAKHTAAGIRTVLEQKRLNKFMAFKDAHNIDLEFHTFQGMEGIASFQDSLGDTTRTAIARYKLNGGKAAPSALWAVAKNMWMWSFNTSESFNRFAAGAGAWSKGKADGLVGAELANFVEDMVRTTQHSYRSSNIPQVLQGPVGGLLGQFKSWFIFEAEFIASLNKQEAARFGGALVALGGISSILAVPGADIIDSAGLLFSDQKFSESLKINDARVRANPESTTLSKTVSRFAAYGAPGLAGVDISNYLGPGSLWELSRGILGPGISDANALFDFVKESTRDLRVQGRVQEGTYSRFVRAVMPSQIRRGKTAVGIMQTGEVRSPYSGKLLYQPERRVRAALAAGFGAPLADASSQRAVDDVVNRISTSYRDVRESYRKQIALATLHGDPGRARSLQTRAGRAGFTFSPSDVQNALKDFSANADQRRQARTPKDLRERFLQDFGTIR